MVKRRNFKNKSQLWANEQFTLDHCLNHGLEAKVVLAGCGHDLIDRRTFDDRHFSTRSVH